MCTLRCEDMGFIKAQCGKTDGSFRKGSSTEWSKLQCQQIFGVQNIFGSLENTPILIEETQLSVTDRQMYMYNEQWLTVHMILYYRCDTT